MCSDVLFEGDRRLVRDAEQGADPAANFHFPARLFARRGSHPASPNQGLGRYVGAQELDRPGHFAKRVARTPIT